MTDEESTRALVVLESLPNLSRSIPSRRRRRAHSNSNGVPDVIIVDSPVQVTNPRVARRRRRNAQSNQNGIVDLTCDDHLRVDLVDLTSSQPRRRPSENEPGRQSDTFTVVSSSIPVASSPTIPTTESSSNDDSSSSILRLNCPVCLESLQSLLKQGCEIKSTTCGHIFCRNCITLAIRSSKKCPTCRKKLSERQTHPLYLPIT